MRATWFAAGVIAALALPAAAGGDSRSDGADAHRANGNARAGHFVHSTLLVPKAAPQPAPARPAAPPPSAAHPAPRAPHASPAPPHAPPPGRSFGHDRFAPRPFIHDRPHPQYGPYFVTPPLVLPPPVYYGYPPPVYVPPPPAYYEYVPAPYSEPPPVYVERDDGYWYYCPELNAYYPDVKECPVPWQQVPPR